MVFKPSIFLAAAAVATLVTSVAIGGGSMVTYGNRHVALAPSFQVPMQCVLDQLKNKSYVPRDVGCFGSRPNNASAHPTGHACDVDQTARNVTRLNHFMSSSGQTQLAQGCKAVSGCIWRHPDCGHFEQISAPYSPAGTRQGGHYYGEKYASHPVRRRR